MSIDEPTNVFRLMLNGPGISLDKEVDQQIALAVLQMALGGVSSPNLSGNPATVAMPERSGPRLSLREFLDSTGAKSNPEKIAIFAMYLRDHAGQELVTKDEVRTCFRSAGEPLPGNYSRDFQLAVQSGWIAEDHGKPGQYYVTRKGDDAVRRKTDII